MTRLAVYDLDGTLLRVDSHALLVAALALRPGTASRRRIELVTGVAAWALGRVDDDATKHLAARALGGRTEPEARAWLRPLVDHLVRRHVRPAVAARLRTDRAEGFSTLLLSASLDLPVAMIAEALGFDHHAGTALARDDDHLAPRLAAEPLRGEAKARHLDAFARHHGVDLARSRAYGDSAADVAVLACVGSPFAVHPDRVLRRVAGERAWPVLDE